MYPYRVTRMRTLLIGADDTTRQALEAVLRERRHDLHVAEADATGWAAFVQQRPEVVVLAHVADDTLFYCRRIRQEFGDEPTLLAILLHEDEACLQQLIEAGADDCLISSLEPDRLHVRFSFIERRIRTEQALKMSEEKYRSLVDTAGSVIVRLDAQAQVVGWNRAAERLFGWTKPEILGQDYFEHCLPETERDRTRAAFQTLMDGGPVIDFENTIRTRSGQVRTLLWNATRQQGEEGYTVLGIGQDITERKQAALALEESQAKVRAVLETTVDGIITIDANGVIESFNKAAEHIFGYTAAEAVGRNVALLMPQPHREEHDGYIQKYQQTRQARIIGIGREVMGQRKDGSTFPLDLAVSEFFVQGRQMFTGVVRDITQRRQLELEILRISEQERRRIGQDLHDGLGQMLTGIGLICTNLARRLHAEGSATAPELDEVVELIRDADQQARSLARGLMPVEVGASGLANSLQRLSVNAERLFGITCLFEEMGTARPGDPTVSVHLYRIAQEAVSNAVKHGHATLVRIALAAGEDQLRLRVQDNGTGFPETLPEDRGMGVRIMHYRARIIGATLDIRRGAEGGTVLTCTLTHTHRPVPARRSTEGSPGRAIADLHPSSQPNNTP
jgi:PAS domain S-box-containing protein